jgi:hypothetical protein
MQPPQVQQAQPRAAPAGRAPQRGVRAPGLPRRPRAHARRPHPTTPNPAPQICVALSCNSNVCDCEVYHQGCVEKYLKSHKLQ